MRALDPRLLRRARPARLLLGADIGIGLATALLILLQATLFARIVARAFNGVTLPDLWTDIVLLALVFALRGALAWGFETTGRRAASAVLSELRLALVERRFGHSPPLSTASRAARSRRPPSRASRRWRRTSRAICRRSCSLCVVPVAFSRGSSHRPRVGADHAADAAARAGVHVADRSLHGAAHAGALAGAAPAVDALPRRRARPADAARVQPQPRAGRRDRRRQRELSPGDDGHAAGRASSRAPSSSWPPRSASRSSR